MNNRVTLDWNWIRAFLATVDRGSLSAAARELGLTQPTLSRQIAALERDLGLTLFERVGKSLILTHTGRELLDEVHAMGIAADRLAIIASGQSQSLEGLVRISASDVFAAYLLPEILEKLHAVAPGIRIEVVSSNDISDLMRREADIAIRHVQPEPAGLISKLCREGVADLYATPDYLDRLGRPISPRDLAHARFIGFSGRNDLIEQLNRRGVPVSEANFTWKTNSPAAAWEMARIGLGICVMFDMLAARTPGIERVLADFEPIPVSTWLVTHRELNTSRRIRLVFDFLAEELS